MPKRISRRKARARANEGGGGRHNEEPKGESYGNAGAVESVESQKQASPSFHEPLGNLAEGRRDSHISTAPATRDGKVENQEQVFHFPTATNPLSRKAKHTVGRAGLRPRPEAALHAA